MTDSDRILAIARFLGDSMTEEQAKRLMDDARATCSIADLEWIKECLPGGPLYTELSMHEGEMGGYGRY